MDPETIPDMGFQLEPKIILFVVVDSPAACRLGMFYTMIEALELAARVQDRGRFPCVIVDNNEPI